MPEKTLKMPSLKVLRQTPVRKLTRIDVYVQAEGLN